METLSKESRLVDQGWEFFEHEGNILRAKLDAPLSIHGYRMGARFFCPVWQWSERQENGIYPFDQRSLLP